MRGKATEKYNGVAKKGITPAYAGKSSFSLSAWLLGTDHPRLCGEKYIITSTRFIIPGSPPPMRGKASPTRKLSRLLRITPAYAGKSPRFRHRFLPRRDHPRLCGEKYEPGIEKSLNLGSPPPMRGKVYFFVYLYPAYRITPAYAGKSDDVDVGTACRRDHPRLCGEKWCCKSGIL